MLDVLKQMGKVALCGVAAWFGFEALRYTFPGIQDLIRLTQSVGAPLVSYLSSNYFLDDYPLVKKCTKMATAFVGSGLVLGGLEEILTPTVGRGFSNFKEDYGFYVSLGASFMPLLEKEE